MHDQSQRYLWFVLLGALWALAASPAEASLRKAHEAFRKGQFSQAMGILQKLEQRRGEHSGIYWLRGHIWYAQRQFKRSTRAYRAALHKAPTKYKPWLYNDLGNSYYRQKQWLRAIHYYSQALTQAPGYERARFNLELALRKLKKKRRKRRPPPPPPPQKRPPPPPPPRNKRKSRKRKPPKIRTSGLKPPKRLPKLPTARRFKLQPFDRFLPYSRLLRHPKNQKRKP